MTERVVDLSRVYQALDLVARARRLAVDRESAFIAKERAAYIVKIIGYGAAACALVIISIGVAIWLARQRHVVEIRQSAPPQREAIVQLPPAAPQSMAPAIPPNKIKTNVSQFNSIDSSDLKIPNRYLSELTAGHRYSNSNADRWASAWCYANFSRDGLTYRVTLEHREGSKAIPRAVSEAERRQLELSEADVSYLRGLCPWKQQ
jgi:hypothetical protein